jgi:signal transduction histidine kinase
MLSESFSKYVSPRLQESSETVNTRHLYLSYALENISEAFLFIDLTGTLIVANKVASKFFSLSKEAIGRSFWEFFPDDYFGFSMKESLKFGLLHSPIYKTQRLLDLEILSSFLLVGPPSDHGLVIVAKDLGKEKHFHAELEKNERMKNLGTMATQIAHEIRNPLGGIRGFASLLVRDLEKQPHLKEMALSIIEGTKILERQMAHILNYARTIQIQLESKDLGALLREIAKFVKVDPAFPPTVKMILHIPNDSVIAPVDPSAMKSLMLNLMFNAIQAMPGGGTLTLSLFKLEGCCQIAVADTGVGIDADTLQHLFSPLFTTKAKGNGLGLTEVEKIVKAHRGRIDVRSELSKGSTFTLTLPLRVL